MDEDLAPTLQNILDQKSLKWIFCGGKGGVGKTTTSCSLAVQLSKVRESVLLISTDPAHNLSDAFGQKFGKDATKVHGFDNLSAMEIDPTSSIREMIEQSSPPLVSFGKGVCLTVDDTPNNPMSGMMQDLAFSIPGVDEAMNFAEVMKQVNSMEYSVIIFDTAPTGHTLRFLSFPTVLEKALAKVSQLSSRFGPMMNQMSGLLGVQQGGTDELFSKLEGMRETVKLVNQQFQDPDKTTFVCVMIAEFLSLWETERMIQELTQYHIDTHNIVINFLVQDKGNCPTCHHRAKNQKKYLDQVDELYEDFHVIKLPLQLNEVRGREAIEKFSTMLLEPFDFEKGDLKIEDAE